MTQSVTDIKRLKRRAIRELLLRGGLPLEGSSSAAELLYLVQTTQRTAARLVGEIGFNAGFSSYAILASCPQVKVVSFDLCKHSVSRAAKKLIDQKFPGRHTLICGDSRESVPRYAADNPGVTLDVAFIDGGHEYEVARDDIENMRALCTPDTAVVMDDVAPWQSWGEGPHKAWGEAIETGAVVQTEVYKDGEPVEVLEPPGKRAWALGQYT